MERTVLYNSRQYYNYNYYDPRVLSNWYQSGCSSDRSVIRIPTFDGRDPVRWIASTEEIFAYIGLNDDYEGFVMATAAMTGDARRWFDWEHHRCPFQSWCEFTTAVHERFQPAREDDVLASPPTASASECALEKVRQLFKEYEARFLTPIQPVTAAKPTMATTLSQPSSFIGCTPEVLSLARSDKTTESLSRLGSSPRSLKYGNLMNLEAPATTVSESTSPDKLPHHIKVDHVEYRSEKRKRKRKKRKKKKMKRKKRKKGLVETWWLERLCESRYGTSSVDDIGAEQRLHRRREREGGGGGQRICTRSEQEEAVSIADGGCWESTKEPARVAKMIVGLELSFGPLVTSRLRYWDYYPP